MEISFSITRRKYPKSQLYGLDFKFGSGVKKELNQANISVIENTMENDSFNNIKFDLITANQIIEHVTGRFFSSQKML